jgi:hypothetical protein
MFRSFGDRRAKARGGEIRRRSHHCNAGRLA